MMGSSPFFIHIQCDYVNKKNDNINLQCGLRTYRMIGLDFEAAPKTAQIPSWNAYHMDVIQVGMYSNKTGKILDETVKADVVLTKWHTENTPHLTQSIIKESADPCMVASKMTEFIKNECGAKCKMVTYGPSDYIWFMKMYENCIDKRKELHIIKHDVYQHPEYKQNKINIEMIDINDILNLKEPYLKGRSLKALYKHTFNEEMQNNHNAAADAKAVAEIAKARFKV